MTSEQHLWANVFDRPGSSVEKSYVTSQLALPSDQETSTWLKDRQHFFKVQYSIQQFFSIMMFDRYRLAFLVSDTALTHDAASVLCR